MPRYKLNSAHTHPEDLDDGRNLAPGDVVNLTKDAAGEPNAKRLIEDGALLPVEQQKDDKGKGGDS
jgi:hypothetical protein